MDRQQTYAEQWIERVNRELSDKAGSPYDYGVPMLVDEWKGIKVGDIVGWSHDDTYGQVKGFMYCWLTKKVEAIIGTNASFGVEFIEPVSAEYETLFHAIADINGDPIKKRQIIIPITPTHLCT